MTLRPLKREDFKAVSNIYVQGIATGIATFETETPDWETWNSKYIESCRLVCTVENNIAGFAVLSQVSNRKVYKGVAEVSVYVAKEYQEKGIGKQLLERLIIESEENGFWTLQASIFSENIGSIRLHEKCGFRVIGIREKIGELNGKWYDNHFLERRSKKLI